MLKTYFKIALRTLERNRYYTIINVVGLSIGIAACLLIFLVVKFELSFDNFHLQKDRIYRVVSVFKSPDGLRYTPGAPFPVAQGLRIDYPQLKKVAAIYGTEGQITIIDNSDRNEKKFQMDNGIFYAEPEFFEIFNFHLLAGNPKTALSEPMTAIISQSTANKYFEHWEDAIGKTFKFKNKYIYKVTGIMENPPANTDFPLEVVLSYSSLYNSNLKRNMSDWVSTFSSANCFILFPLNMDASKFDSDLEYFVKKHKPPEYYNEKLTLQPLSEMHFDSRYGNYNNKTFSRELISALSLIAFFLLVIACINFVNLATAQAVNRSREVGIRKVLGSNQRQLIIQFMFETLFIVIISMVFAYAIAEFTLPALNKFLQLNLVLNVLNDPSTLIFTIMTALMVTTLSGFYPAIILSGFSPLKSLKSKSTVKFFGGISLRRGLVIFQFIISQVLIICVFVVLSQMDLFKNASLGFNKDEVILVPVPDDSLSLTKIGTLKNMLLEEPSIKDVSFSTFSPIDDSHWNSDFKFDNSSNNTDFVADLKWADANYFKLYKFQFLAGRPYEEADTVKAFVVNESLVKKLGIANPNDIIGKKINFWNNEIKASIVGVVKDFNSHPLKSASGPIVFGSWKAVYDLMNVKISPYNIKETLSRIKSLWDSEYPEYIYHFTFLDEKINDFYKKEDQLSALYKLFALLAIFISCLGLIGLVSFMVTQKTREMGVRKVLGASAFDIIFLLSKEFTLLIILAFLIAAPTAYYIMKNWLMNYAYHIRMGAGIFLLAIVISVLIAWFSVGYLAIKAARANPVEALRYE